MTCLAILIEHRLVELGRENRHRAIAYTIYRDSLGLRVKSGLDNKWSQVAEGH